MSRKSHKPGKHIRKENKKIIHHNLRDSSERNNAITPLKLEVNLDSTTLSNKN